MRKSHDYGLFAVFALAVALALGIANTACYGEVEFHVYKSSYGCNWDNGDGFACISYWDANDSYAYAIAYDGPTWSTASTGIGNGTAVILRYTTGGTGSEELEWSYWLRVSASILGNAKNDDPNVAGYGWAHAWADAVVQRPYPQGDDSASVDLCETAEEPEYFDEDSGDIIEWGWGTCYTNAIISVYHESRAAAYITNDAEMMRAESEAQVQSYLALLEQ